MTPSSSGEQVQELPHIWIEHRDGSIARGAIVLLSADIAVVRLVGPAWLSPGEDVAVRIALRQAARTLSGTARIASVGTAGDTAVCELRWTHVGPEREHLTLAAAR